MKPTLHIGTPAIEVRLKPHSRARRFTLRLSRQDGQATLTLPPRTPERAARAFLERQEGWLRAQMARQPRRRCIEAGTPFPLRGRDLPLRFTTGRGVRLTETELQVATPDPARRLQAFLKVQAREDIVPLVARYSARIERHVSRITLRDTRSRWGSCSSEGRLMFSWRLVMAPPEVLEYVVAHEVAHLREMNHSPAFWALVASLMPDYETRRDWLRRHGAGLHAFDFGA